MELNEAVRRILGRHLWLIILCVLAGTSIGVGMHAGDVPLHQATTRLVLGTSDPTTQEASQGIADTARGIASGPATIKAALDDLGVSRDPHDLAKHHVTVEALGSSGVLLLTVTDPDPRVAIGLANKLSDVVVETRNRITNGPANEIIAGLDQQIADITDNIVGVSTRIDRLDAAIASASSPGKLPDLEAARSRLVAIQTNLSNERAALQVERSDVAAQNAQRLQAAVVDSASLAPDPVPSGVVPDAVLGGLLGLLIGVIAAGCLEVLRPRVTGREALQREMGAPVLGQIPGGLSGLERLDRAAAVAYVNMAAASSGVDRVQLIGAEPAVDLAPLAGILRGADGSEEDGRVAVSVVGEIGTRDVEHASATTALPAATDRARAGFVLVTPADVPRSHLQPVSDLLAISRLPLIGIITYERKRGVRRLRFSRATKRTRRSSRATVVWEKP
jgi:capsular polysaccharide biosynthesis protein